MTHWRWKFGMEVTTKASVYVTISAACSSAVAKLWHCNSSSVSYPEKFNVCWTSTEFLNTKHVTFLI